MINNIFLIKISYAYDRTEANAYGNVDFTSAKEDVNYSGKWYFYECLFEITNNATFKMPMTGDSGTRKYGFADFGIIMAISTGLVVDLHSLLTHYHFLK